MANLNRTVAATGEGISPDRRFPHVILIGPVTAGKSTIAALLAERLDLPHVSLDAVAEPYYEECGLAQAAVRQLAAEQGFLPAYRQWCPALAHATERVLVEHPYGILDLGAGHSHYEDKSLFHRVQQVLAACPNIILLLPSPDLEQSVQLLRQRSVSERGWGWAVDGYDFMEHWVKDSCNHELATLTVYTEGRTPAQTADEILPQLRSAK